MLLLCPFFGMAVGFGGHSRFVRVYFYFIIWALLPQVFVGRFEDPGSEFELYCKLFRNLIVSRNSNLIANS